MRGRWIGGRCGTAADYDAMRWRRRARARGL